MELNIVAAGIELVGTTNNNISVENTIVDVERDAKRSIGLNINEPYYEKMIMEFFHKLELILRLR